MGGGDECTNEEAEVVRIERAGGVGRGRRRVRGKGGENGERGRGKRMGEKDGEGDWPDGTLDPGVPVCSIN